MVITPLFWIVLAPGLFPSLGWHGLDLVMRCHLTTLHTLPLLFSTLNIIVTNMKFEVSFWPKIVFMGFQYMIANAIGVYNLG